VINHRSGPVTRTSRT